LTFEELGDGSALTGALDHKSAAATPARETNTALWRRMARKRI
jgi:hypothetical protein